MSTSDTGEAAASLPTGYLELVQRFPLMVIQADAQHARAMKMIDELHRVGDDNLSAGQIDYFRVLARLVSAYELGKFGEPRATPLDVVKFLMQQHNMKPGDLGKILGSPQAASNVLKGGRELSKAHIVALAARFKVSPALFIDMGAKKAAMPRMKRRKPLVAR